MSEGLPPLTNAGAVPTMLDHDVACRRCAYNLRGLHEDGRCPECGTPVGLSLRGFMLCYADPDWVDKVARGLTIILWMILIGVIGGIASKLLRFDSAVMGMLKLGIGAVSFYGAWLLTAPDPSGIGEDPNLTAQKVVRLALVADLIGKGLSVLKVGVNLGEVGNIALMVTAVVAALLAVVGEFAKFVYYQRLAERIPNATLANRANFLKWAFTISLGVLLVGGAVSAAVAASSGPTGSVNSLFITLGCLMAPIIIALLVFAIMTLVLLIRLRRELAAEARRARATWYAQPAPPAADPAPRP